MKRAIIAVLFLALLTGGGVAYQAFRLKAAEVPAAAKGAAPGVPVMVAAVERKAMPVQIEAIGTVQPISTVAVKSRVDGQIAEVRVADGQYVHKGDILFVLDTREGEALLAQAQAQLAHDRAQLENAQKETQRYRPLTDKQYVSREQMDQLATNAAALEASVAADEATVDTFKVRLTYNTIVSPMDGRIGVVGLKAGNEVKAQDTITMLTINQIKPIYVAYSVPQTNLPAIRAAMKAGIVPVTASIPGDNNGLDPGRVSLFDNQIDAATGTIGLRAIFDNNDERLWPGEFVNVTTTVRVDPDALVIPQAALLVGQNGNYVYVVKSDGTVEARTVTVDRTVANQTVVSKGLAEGERVVTDGQSRVTDGTRVEIRTNAGGGNQAERSS